MAKTERKLHTFFRTAKCFTIQDLKNGDDFLASTDFQGLGGQRVG